LISKFFSTSHNFLKGLSNIAVHDQNLFLGWRERVRFWYVQLSEFLLDPVLIAVRVEPRLKSMALNPESPPKEPTIHFPSGVMAAGFLRDYPENPRSFDRPEYGRP
jgi:hypothetical protein